MTPCYLACTAVQHRCFKIGPNSGRFLPDKLKSRHITSSPLHKGAESAVSIRHYAISQHDWNVFLKNAKNNKHFGDDLSNTVDMRTWKELWSLCIRQTSWNQSFRAQSEHDVGHHHTHTHTHSVLKESLEQCKQNTSGTQQLCQNKKKKKSFCEYYSRLNVRGGGGGEKLNLHLMGDPKNGRTVKLLKKHGEK